jgi:hypothetical protein
VVIIRYADTYAPISGYTGTFSVTVSGGYRVYRFLTSGTLYL